MFVLTGCESQPIEKAPEVWLMCLFWIISHDSSLTSEPIRTSKLQKILNLDFMTHRQCDSYISARLYICLTFSGISSDIFFLIAHRNSLPAKLLTNSIWNYPYSPLIECSKSKHNRWSEPDQSVTLFFVCKSRIGKYLTLEYILSGLLRILFSRYSIHRVYCKESSAMTEEELHNCRNRYLLRNSNEKLGFFGYWISKWIVSHESWFSGFGKSQNHVISMIAIAIK